MGIDKPTPGDAGQRDGPLGIRRDRVLSKMEYESKFNFDKATEALDDFRYTAMGIQTLPPKAQAEVVGKVAELRRILFEADPKNKGRQYQTPR